MDGLLIPEMSFKEDREVDIDCEAKRLAPDDSCEVEDIIEDDIDGGIEVVFWLNSSIETMILEDSSSME